jgi:hypothetical protein
MPRHRNSSYSYDTTSLQIRCDLNFLRKEKKWNLRKMIEEFLLTRVTSEDLAYAESVRLGKELEKNKKILEQSEQGVVKI